MNDPARPVAGEDTPSVPFSIEELDYDLPERLIAQRPADHRDQARLMVLRRPSETISHTVITELPSLLRPGDLLVLNDSRVLPARILARRATGGLVPGLYVSSDAEGRWEVMLQSSRRLNEGEVLEVLAREGNPMPMRLLRRLEAGHWIAEVARGEPAEAVLARVGKMPLPPYIRRGSDPRERDETDIEDEQRYQTVYAAQPGSIAAPTAGLHFTEGLLADLGRHGVETCFVTLHVGVGTFKPVTASRLEDHRMHREFFEISPATTRQLQACRSRGGRIVAVGTTTTRVLESLGGDLLRPAANDLHEPARNGSTDLFIRPPYRFQVIDALLTNFHLPRSTLLALVMAFAGMEFTRRAYAAAVEQQYRFFSYGDAMLIL